MHHARSQKFGKNPIYVVEECWKNHPSIHFFCREQEAHLQSRILPSLLTLEGVVMCFDL